MVYYYLQEQESKLPVSNNFAIGTLPEFISATLIDVTGPLLSPMRPFAYIMSYSGGAHKRISGSFSFFSQNVEKKGWCT